MTSETELNIVEQLRILNGKIDELVQVARRQLDTPDQANAVEPLVDPMPTDWIPPRDIYNPRDKM